MNLIVIFIINFYNYILCNNLYNFIYKIAIYKMCWPKHLYGNQIL